MDIERKKDKFICYDLDTLRHLLGTTAAGENKHLYDVNTFSNPKRYEVPVRSVELRVEAIERKVSKELEYLRIMKRALVKVRG